MSSEFLPGHEAADQIDLDQLFDEMKRWLLGSGHMTGNSKVPRMADGAAIYEVLEGNSFSREVESYELTLDESKLSQLDPIVKSTLHIGEKVVFAYTPGHYLVAQDSGKLEPTPESFQAFITPSPDLPLKELSFSVTHLDFDDPTFVGHRDEIVRESSQQHVRSDLELIFDPTGRGSVDILASLDTPTRQECAALIEIASVMRQLK